MTGLARTAEISRCGRQYATEDEARRSAEYRTEKSGVTYQHVACRLGEHWHVRPEAAKAEPGKVTRKGTGPDARTRALVWARDGGCCAMTGQAIRRGMDDYSVQHRVARGVGGRNGLSNLLLLAGSATTGAHRIAEDRGEEAHLAGFWLRSTENPLEHPVRYATASGYRWFLLDNDGGRTEVDEPSEWQAFKARRTA